MDQIRLSIMVINDYKIGTSDKSFVDTLVILSVRVALTFLARWSGGNIISA